VYSVTLPSVRCAQEVFGSASPRMSIQGWYHADAPPPGADKASLSLLQAMREDGEDDDSHDFPEVNEQQEEQEKGGLNEVLGRRLRQRLTLTLVLRLRSAEVRVNSKQSNDGRRPGKSYSQQHELFGARLRTVLFVW